MLALARVGAARGVSGRHDVSMRREAGTQYDDGVGQGTTSADAARKGSA
jgi:hypothetical protein